MKDWIFYGWNGQGPGPLAISVTLLVLGMALLSCQASPGMGGSALAAEKGKPETKTPARTEVALLAGGCFWGMEEILRQVPGVIDVENGYTGGFTPHPTYRDVSSGVTGHAESVRVLFDPDTISYAELLEKYFFRMHDPTTRNRQGNDIGSQYRSAIFATTPEQKKIAQEVKEKVDRSGFWSAPIVTEVVDAGPFTLAEEYHQDYLEKNPGGYTCHFLRG